MPVDGDRIAPWHAYCQSHGIPHKRIGKLIVATAENEIEALDGLMVTGDFCSAMNYRYFTGHLPRDYQQNHSRTSPPCLEGGRGRGCVQTVQDALGGLLGLRANRAAVHPDELSLSHGRRPKVHLDR